MVIAEELVVEVEEEEVDEGVKPMRWWVMVLMLLFFCLLPFFSCLVLIWCWYWCKKGKC